MVGFVSPQHFVKNQTPHPNPCNLLPNKISQLCILPPVSQNITPSHLTKTLPLAFRESGA